MKKVIIIGIIAIVIGFFVMQTLIRTKKDGGLVNTPTPTPLPTAFTLSSSAFGSGAEIPIKYTCDGENISPPLTIYNIPNGTVSLTLIIDDIDAPRGTFVHWLLWNIDPKTSQIDAGTTPTGAGIGVNDFREIKYGGPCPTTGEHKYLFTLYAVDKYLVFSEKTTKNQVLDAMNQHIIAKTELMGVFSR